MPTVKRRPVGPTETFGKPIPRDKLTVGEVCAELQIAQSGMLGASECPYGQLSGLLTKSGADI